MISLETEQAVLGAFLRAGSTPLFGRVSIDDFGVEEHRALLLLMDGLAKDGRPITVAALAPGLQEVKIGDISGTQYLGRLLSVAATPSNLPDAIRVLHETAARRALVDISQQMSLAATKPDTGIASTCQWVAQRMDDLLACTRSQRKTQFTMAEASEMVMANLTNGTGGKGITTGLITLDKFTGGFWRKELVIIAAVTSMGKSAVLCSMLRQSAKKGTSILLFSLEMSAEAVMQRMMSDAVYNHDTPIPYSTIRDRKVAPHDIPRLREVKDEIDKYEIHIDETPALTCTDIALRVRRKQDELEKQGKALDFVIADHMGKIKASDRYKGQIVQEVGEKSASLAEIAKSTDTAVIAAHQLNRGVNSREDRHPQLQDLRNSGDIEQDADMVLFPYREAYYLEREKFDDQEKDSKRIKALQEVEHNMDVVVAKQRMGPTGTIELFADMASNAIRDLAHAR